MSSYKNVMRVVNKHANTKESYLIDTIFPLLSPGIRKHLTESLEHIVNSVTGFHAGLWYFYIGLDAENSAIFDKWFEGELTKLV